MTSHPVHIIDADANLSPTSLIPFCSINDNYSEMGVKIDQIDVPVCNSFQPKLVRDQLCYTVDLNQIKPTKNSNIKSKEKMFFSFFIDYNEDREFSSENKAKKQIEDDNEIIIETIGTTFLSLP